MSTPSFARLGSANMYDTSRNNLMTRQTGLANVQEQLTSGKRVNSASDDPIAAAQAERAMTRISRIQTDQRALDAQRNAITQAESTLGDVTDTMQNFRELVVSAGSGSLSSVDRTTIAGQLQGLRDQIFALSNRKDTNGQPLFGALASALTPFVGPQGGAPDYTFKGLPGQTGSSEVAIPFSVDGDSAFMHQPARDGVFNASVSAIPAGRTLTTDNVVVTSTATVAATAVAATAATGVPYPSYNVSFSAVDSTTTPGTTTLTYNITETPSVTPLGAPAPFAPVTVSYPSSTAAPITGIPGLSFSVSGTPAVGDSITINERPSIFSVLDDAIKNIGGASNNNAAIQAVNQALGNIDIGMSRVSAVRGQAGDLLNRADTISSNQDKRSIQLEADRSSAEDIDMVKGISDFQKQQTGYQAALQSYALVQKLSLFNFIS
ncbi:MAG: flagellar hook-associated protein FlgL [Rhodoferax sp.]